MIRPARGGLSVNPQVKMMAMITVDLGREGLLRLEHAVFDVNGTLTRDGQLFDGVIERMHTLRELVDVHLLTANAYRTQDSIDQALAVTTLPNIRTTVLRTEDGPEDEQKVRYITRLGIEKVVAIGNGRNDRLMLERAVLSITVIGPEGAASDALKAAKVVVSNPVVALDLLLHPIRLKATLRV
jgi:soluble P-type ATPase